MLPMLMLLLLLLLLRLLLLPLLSVFYSTATTAISRDSAVRAYISALVKHEKNGIVHVKLTDLVIRFITGF